MLWLLERDDVAAAQSLGANHLRVIIRFVGKTVIVTGAARGVGRALVHAFVDAGASGIVARAPTEIVDDDVRYDWVTGATRG